MIVLFLGFVVYVCACVRLCSRASVLETLLTALTRIAKETDSRGRTVAEG